MIKLKKGSVAVAIMVSIILVLLIIAGVWIYLMKSNKYIGLGETLRPYIKDTPVLNMFLPDLPDDSVPALFARDELENKYTVKYTENQLLTARVEELEAELAAKEDVSGKYEILLTEVETLNQQIAQMEAQRKQEAENKKSEEFNNMVKVYESMEASESAKLLEQIGTLNLDLVIEICKAMKTSTFSSILVEMDDDFAAILSERMISE